MTRNIPRRVLFTICFVLVAVTDWIVGTQDGRLQFAAFNLLTAEIGLIILSTYRMKDLLRPVYYIWGGIVLIGAPLAILWGHGNYSYQGKFITAVINVCIYGFILIHCIESQIRNRKMAKLRWPVFVIWFLTMIMMSFNPDRALWPVWFAVAFGAFYMTDFDAGDCELLLTSMVDGIIITFILMLAGTFMVRPYDDPRYRGAYINANNNALFYLMVYCAFLCKKAILKKNKKAMVLQILTAVAAGVTIGLIVLTGCRTALLSMLAVTVIYLLCLLREHKGSKDSFGPVKQILVLALVAVVSIPLVYLPVRYLPTVFHRPVFWVGEYSTEKVHSFDPADSAKYVSFREMLGENLGRILFFLPSDVFESEDNAVKEESFEKLGNVTYYLDSTEKLSTMKQREYIYRYYIRNLRFLGHSQLEDGFWLSPRYYEVHAHDFLIQMAFRYGIPVGLAFLFLLVYCGICFAGLLKKRKTVPACVFGCFITAFIVYGLFEFDWGLGQLSYTLFFVLLYFVMNKGIYEDSVI